MKGLFGSARVIHPFYDESVETRITGSLSFHLTLWGGIVVGLDATYFQQRMSDKQTLFVQRTLQSNMVKEKRQHPVG